MKRRKMLLKGAVLLGMLGLALTAAPFGTAGEPVESMAELPEELWTEAAVDVDIRGRFCEEDGLLYCNAETCGVEVSGRITGGRDHRYELVLCVDGREELTRQGEFDGEEEESPAYWSGISSEVKLKLPAEELVPVLSDGVHEVYAAVCEDGAILAELRRSFVLDTMPPLVQARLVTEAANTRPADGRFYLNADIRFELVTEEEHYDAESFWIRRDFASAEQTDARSAVPNCEGDCIFSENGVFSDVIDEDGVWIYRIFGTDRAGNEAVAELWPDFHIRSERTYASSGGPTIITEGALIDAQTSAVLVRDTQAPHGSLAVYADGTRCYSLTDRGTVTARERFSDTAALAVSVSSDPGERSPVLLGGRIVSEGEDQAIGSGAAPPDLSGEGDAVYASGAVCEKSLRTGLRFRLEDVWILDMAGNITWFPKSDELVPEVTARPEPEDVTQSDKPEDTSSSLPEAQGEELRRTETETSSPSFTVTFINNNAKSGSFFNRPRTAVIRVRRGSVPLSLMRIRAEGGTAEPGWQQEGDFDVKYIRFTTSGTCSLEVYALDGIGRRFEAESIIGIAPSLFVVDRLRPSVTIEGIADRSAYAVLPSAALRIRDTYAADCRAELTLRRGTSAREEKISSDMKVEEDGSLMIYPELPREDGFYTLRCDVTDPAGNLTRRSLSYSINAAGTAYEFRQSSACGQTVREFFRPEVILHDLSEVYVLSAAVNGRETEVTREGSSVFFDSLPQEDGRYVLTLTTRDGAGHTGSMEPVEFTVDTTPPEAVIRLPGGGSEFGESVRAELLSDDAEAVPAEVLLDGRSVRAERGTGEAVWYVQVETEGTHVLSASFTDKAGNTGEVKQRTFMIRRSSPVLRITRILVLLGLLVLVAAGIHRKRRKGMRGREEKN